jgi:predicted HTH transcriptional regulator
MDAHLTGLGVVAMAEKPRRFIAQAGLNALVRTVDGERPVVPFNDPAVLVPDLVEVWLRKEFPELLDLGHMVAGTKERLPFGAVREGLINALVHRRWDQPGKVRLLVDDQEQLVVIKSPGGPPAPVTLPDLERLDAETHPRNERLTTLFSKLDIVQESNLGMRTFRSMPDRGFPRPSYTLNQEVLTLTMFRNRDLVTEQRIKEATWMTPTLKQAWKVISSLETLSTDDYMRTAGVGRSTAKRHLAPFIDKRWIAEVPGTSGAHLKYRVVIV